MYKIIKSFMNTQTWRDNSLHKIMLGSLVCIPDINNLLTRINWQVCKMVYFWDYVLNPTIKAVTVFVGFFSLKVGYTIAYMATLVDFSAHSSSPLIPSWTKNVPDGTQFYNWNKNTIREPLSSFGEFSQYLIVNEIWENEWACTFSLHWNSLWTTR